MFSYFAVLSQPSPPAGAPASRTLADLSRAFSKGWSELPPGRGLRVFYRDARAGTLDAHTLADGGAVLGAVFERAADRLDEAPAPSWQPDAARTEAIRSSQGRWLVEHCWGNYVAVVPDAERNRVWVLKDPTGELPCYVAVLDGVALIFSSIPDVIATGLLRPSVSASYLAARVLLSGITELQPLEGIEQVSRGECVAIDLRQPERRSRRCYWHPSAFAETEEPLENPASAARLLRATVHSCTRTWARGHTSVLHRLSGGLDSSIIAACLRAAHPDLQVCCYTYFNPRGRSDERPWARLAAKPLAGSHVELPVAPKDIALEHALSMPRLIEPVPVMGFLQRSTLEAEIAGARHATAVFCGDGGDSGFGGEAFAYSLSEYLARHGVRPAALRLATEIATLTEQSTWAVIAKALRRWRERATGRHDGTMAQLYSALRLSSQLVSAQARREAELPTHYPLPWFHERVPVPWATIRRLGRLLSSPQFYDVAPDVRAPEVIAPLYSQPAVELLLRIPIYVHFEGGRERGLARRAFAGEVPAPILNRLWKDRSPGFYNELLYRNRGFLREVLLDGILVRERLLDRAALERTLSDTLARDAVLPTEVFRHLDVEIWARTWRA